MKTQSFDLRIKTQFTGKWNLHAQVFSTDNTACMQLQAFCKNTQKIPVFVFSSFLYIKLPSNSVFDICNTEAKNTLHFHEIVIQDILR